MANANRRVITIDKTEAHSGSARQRAVIGSWDVLGRFGIVVYDRQADPAPPDVMYREFDNGVVFANPSL